MSIGSGTDEGKGAHEARRSALKRIGGLWAATAAAPWIAGCDGGGSPAPAGSPPSVSTTPAPPPPPTSSGPAFVTTLTTSLSSPWGMAFLPDGRMLVTQKGGSMVIVSADGLNVEATVSGVNGVLTGGQGGLLDVVLDPDFETDPWVYWSYSRGTGSSNATAVARGRLVGSSLQNVNPTLFVQTPNTDGNGHFGCRLAFRGDKTLFIALGERQKDDPSNPGTQFAQNTANHFGKVVRINRDGSIPSNNPSFGAGAAAGLWSIGHRNPQGAAIHPTTGELWIVEHGPQGGDELNRVVAGGNYGWPLRSYGCPYGSTPADSSCWVNGGTHAPTYVEPVSYWVPFSIAPAGLIFYTGDKFPEWQGHAFLGALAGTSLWRVGLNGNSEADRESLQVVADLGQRIRCVRQGPDGWIYLLTDSGQLLRLER